MAENNLIHDPPKEWWENTNLVNEVTRVVREADQLFQTVGGSSRHWVRECFLPLMDKAGLEVRIK